ncbi:18452_t:CDS:1, partial [Racocetra fulgida]
MSTLSTSCKEFKEYEPTPPRNEPEKYEQTISYYESEDFESIPLPLDESEASEASLICASKSNIVHT